MLNLNYPVLTYSQKHLRGNIKSEKEFCRSIESYVDRGGFLGDTIVDATGKRFKISSVEKLGRVFAPWYNLFNSDKFLKIDFQVTDLPSLELEELKSILMNKIISNRGWRSSGQTVSEIQAYFNKFNSFEALTSYGFASGK